jgi:hypothetical protein
VDAVVDGGDGLDVALCGESYLASKYGQLRFIVSLKDNHYLWNKKSRLPLPWKRRKASKHLGLFVLQLLFWGLSWVTIRHIIIVPCLLL